MESIDRPPVARRHLVLLLVVFVVPEGALTALAIRTLDQDRELAVRREEDGRRQLAAAIRQELLARLEALTLRALSGAVAGRENRPRDPADPIVLVALIEEQRLVLPWGIPAGAAEVGRVLAEQPFARLITRGERAELVDRARWRATSAASSPAIRRTTAACSLTARP